MNDKDNRFGMFGRGERTIIRPNPGARRPAAPAVPAAPGAQPAAPPAAPGPLPSYPSGPPPSYPASPGSPGYQGAPPGAAPIPYAAAPRTQAQEEWIQTTPAPAAVEAPVAVQLKLDELAAPHENPIMRAAGPLLLLLGRLRVALMRASFASLMEQVAEAIKFFEKDIRSAGIPEDQANTAKYILCATADDIVQNIPTEDRHVWTQYSMLSRFFGERIGGVRFFEELERALKDPLVNYPLLELQHACLALGFQGLHRTTPNGQSQLQQIQRNLYETLRRIRPKVIHDLSPRWQGQQLAANDSRFRVPTWAVASIAAALLVGLYVTLRMLLAGGSDATAETTATLHPSDGITIARRVVAPPPPPPPPPKEPEIIKFNNCIQFVPTATMIVIRLCGEFLFDSGSADVKSGFAPVAADIARYLNDKPGKVKVIGHTDSTPIKTVRFPSNQELSKERANAVANMIKKGMTQADRVETDGRGPDVPVDTNASPEGRAKNRRVEVLVPRS